MSIGADPVEELIIAGVASDMTPDALDRLAAEWRHWPRWTAARFEW